MRVVGFGEGSVDYVHVVPELPGERTSKLRISASFVSLGGQVATAMAACASLGLEAGYLGPVGDDENGRRLLETLRSRGVDTSRAIVRRASTRFAVIIVDERSGERTVLWNRDERLDAGPDGVARELVAGADILHVDATDERTSLGLARLAAGTGATVTCDVDSVTAQTRELVAAVTIPILAERLPHDLTGETDVGAALRAIRRPHQRLVCVTRGNRGAVALDGDELIEVPALRVNVVDTTGAGDVFRAGFIYALVQRWPTERMLRFANAAAALACTRRGAISSVPTLDEVVRAL